MTRFIRLSTACLVSALALGALGAPAAQAAPGRFTAEIYPALLIGGGALQISTGNGIRSVGCGSAPMATAIGAASAVGIFGPSFFECSSAPGGGASEVVANKCTFEASVPELTKPELSTKITNCPATAPLEVIAKGAAGEVICNYAITNQGPLGGTSWAKNAIGFLTISFAVASKVQATVTTGTKLTCGQSKGKEITLSWSQSLNIKGYEEKGGVKGAQISIEIG